MPHGTYSGSWVLLGLLLLEVLPQPSKVPPRSSEPGGKQPLWARGSNNCRGDRFIWPKFQLWMCFASMILHSPFIYFGNPRFLQMSALGVSLLHHLCLWSLHPTLSLSQHWQLSTGSDVLWSETPSCELLEGKDSVLCLATLKPQYKHRASVLKILIKSMETRSSCW